MSDQAASDELTPSEAAKLLGVNETTVRAWLREGLLPARRTRPPRTTKTGRTGMGHWRVLRSDVEALRLQQYRDARVLKRQVQEDRQPPT